MNSRIKLVNDTEVLIERCPTFCCTVRRYKKSDGLNVYHIGERDGTGWDSEGIAALIDCLNCYRDTGSFAALSDESEVPYTGKRMREDCTGLSHELHVIDIHDTYVYYRHVGGGVGHFLTKCLLPLTPAPKYRPYTPVEAAAHLGRKLEWSTWRYIAKSVDEKGVRFESPSGWMHINYDGLVGDNYKWADDGTPCGIRE